MPLQDDAEAVRDDVMQFVADVAASVLDGAVGELGGARARLLGLGLRRRQFGDDPVARGESLLGPRRQTHGPRSGWFGRLRASRL